MQLLHLLHKKLRRELPFIHKVRLACLFQAVASLLVSNKLSLTALGRSLINRAKPRSNIRKFARLLVNKYIIKERAMIYGTIARQIIGSRSQPMIHIDWSCVCATTNIYLLRASLSMPGRSLTIYEESYSKKYENNHRIHKKFLNNLKAILPAHVTPIIVTDAGFRGIWFAYIRQIGWHYVGRLRNKNAIYLETSKNWQLSSAFFPLARLMPQYLGLGLLTKRLQLPVHLIAYKGKSKKRHRLNINKKRSSASKSLRHAKAGKEPWILVTSLGYSPRIAKKVVKIYSQRMRIEENFRDTKNTKYGFGLNCSVTRSCDGINALLLIAALATLLAWLAGIHMKNTNRAADYQSQSSRNIGVLSYVFLGREALRKKLRILAEEFEALWKHLLDLAALQDELVS